MKKILWPILLSLTIHCTLQAGLTVGTGVADMTPMPGTPSAGYAARRGEGMEGTHDPLLAIALCIQTDSKQIVFCSVDHLGFDTGMIAEVQKRVGDETCEIFVSSSHTHSGGGAFIQQPGFGEILAGKFSPAAREFYIQAAVEAILQSQQNKQPAKIGIGYGTVEGLSFYRGQWPQEAVIPNGIAVLKITRLDDTPIAVLFNYALHPTVLSADNRLFSADFVGYARDQLKQSLHPEITALYVNGAQGDLIPIKGDEEGYERCHVLGCALAESVLDIWEQIEPSEDLCIETLKERYVFDVIATPQGLKPPLDKYPTEINLIVLNGTDAILTIPGELSCHYDVQIKAMGKAFGYNQVSIFGLTNDAHGYIILPESWEHGTSESRLCFGGPFYGEKLKERARKLLLNIFAGTESTLQKCCNNVGQSH